MLVFATPALRLPHRSPVSSGAPWHEDGRTASCAVQAKDVDDLTRDASARRHDPMPVTIVSFYSATNDLRFAARS